MKQCEHHDYAHGVGANDLPCNRPGRVATMPTVHRSGPNVLELGDRAGRELLFVRQPSTGEVVVYSSESRDEVVAWLTREQANVLAVHLSS